MNGTRIIPNLFMVGAPKCGTTALYTFLGQHPEIFMARDKENNHFATDLIPLDDLFRSDEKYFAMFKDAGDKKIVGENSNHYLLSRAAAGNIFRCNPESKIIIMLRNPVEMLQSFHAQLVYNGDEDIVNFEAAMDAETKRKNGELNIKRPLRVAGKLFYSEVVAYAEQVQRYINLFPKEQVHVIIYDDFKKDTAGVYQKTLEFLNVDPKFKPEFQIVNTRKPLIPKRSMKQGGWKRMVLRMAGRPSFPIDFFKKITPGLLQESVKRILSSSKPVTRPDQQYPTLNPETRRQLQKKYRPEIEKLGIVLGRDLSYWWMDVRP